MTETLNGHEPTEQNKLVATLHLEVTRLREREQLLLAANAELTQKYYGALSELMQEQQSSRQMLDIQAALMDDSARHIRARVKAEQELSILQVASLVPPGAVHDTIAETEALPEGVTF